MTRALVILSVVLWATAAGAADPFAAAGIDPRPGGRIPFDLTFRDQSGAPMTLRQAAGGKPILLVPVQHHCPNICGVTLAGLVQAIGVQDYRPGPDFSLIAFGIDPREGPAEALRSAEAIKVGHALTGDAAEIAAVTEALGYRYAWDDDLGQYIHIAATAVLTGDGRLSRWLYGLAPDPTDIRLALTEAGEGKIGSWTDQLLLFCYHYDPAAGRYGPVIWSILRYACLALVGLGLLLILRALARERRRRGRPA
jgi:protein SCO1/2